MDEASGWRTLSTPARPPASPFTRLAVAHVLAAAGDAFAAVALAGSLFFDLSPSAARSRVALSLILTVAPFALVAPFLGPAIDRVPGGRRAMVVVAALGRAALCLGLAASLRSLALFPLAFATLVLGKAHGVAKSSLVPSAVDTESRLVEANSKLSLVGVLGGLAGASVAALVNRLVGAEWSLRVGAVVFALAALAASRISEQRSPDEVTGEAGGHPLLDPHVMLAASSMAVLRLCAGLLAFLLAFSLRRQGASSWWFAVMVVSSMVGTLAGAAVAPRLRGVVREESMLTGALMGVAAACVLAARASARPVSAMAALALGVAVSGAKLAFDSLVQRDAPGASQGRTFARFEALFQMAWVAGAMVPTLIAISDRAGFFIMSVLCAVTALSVVAGARSPGPGEVHPRPR